MNHLYCCLLLCPDRPDMVIGWRQARSRKQAWFYFKRAVRGQYAIEKLAVVKQNEKEK